MRLGGQNSSFIYIILHPGVFRILVGMIPKFLNSKYGIILKSGKADRFGEAVTKILRIISFLQMVEYGT